MHARFQYSNTEATSGETTVVNVLQKSDEVIQQYVDMIVNKYPGKIDNLKKILNSLGTKAQNAINIAIGFVTDGTFGYSKTREEAINKLQKWASGEMEIELKKEINEFNASVESLAKSMGETITNYKEPDMGFDMFATMKEVGQKYLISEEIRRKINMALDHLQTSLNAKNNNTSSFTMTSTGS